MNIVNHILKHRMVPVTIEMVTTIDTQKGTANLPTTLAAIKNQSYKNHLKNVQTFFYWDVKTYWYATKINCIILTEIIAESRDIKGLLFFGSSKTQKHLTKFGTFLSFVECTCQASYSTYICLLACYTDT